MSYKSDTLQSVTCIFLIFFYSSLFIYLLFSDLLDDEEAIHLEEISDDELEEDRQAKFSKC